MWQQIAINLVVMGVKRLIDAGLFAWIQDTVADLANSGLSGTERREALLRRKSALIGALGEVAAETSGSLINLAIEAAVARQKLGKP